MATTQAATSIDVEALKNAMTEKCAVFSKSEPYTFSPVPYEFRRGNERLYKPKVISFGPYHHGTSHLQAMEKHKWRYLRDFLSRSTTGATLGECLIKMKALEEEARSCYRESITLTTLRSDEFVEMMVLDACFILELAFKLHNKEGTNLEGLEFSGMDLLLIENQIPFFIIRELFNVVVNSTAETSNPPLNELILCLYKMSNIFEMPKEAPSLPTVEPNTVHHLLHLYHLWFVASVKPSTVPSRCWPKLRRVIRLLFSCFSSKMSNTQFSVIPRATKLYEAGVRFKKKRVPSHLLDITFQDGVMEMPIFLIDEATKPLFSNLIALEQSMCCDKRNMTSFCVLMDCLINTKKDVAILQRSNVIQNLLGSEKEVVSFFNILCKYAINWENPYYDDIKRNIYRARLCHDYFSNPWA